MKWVIASLVIATTTRNITEMMMEHTNGTGCGENRYFSLYPRNAFCCGGDPEHPWVWNKQKVWRIKPWLPEKGPISGVCLARAGVGNRMMDNFPGCACKQGSDLKLKQAQKFFAQGQSPNISKVHLNRNRICTYTW